MKIKDGFRYDTKEFEGYKYRVKFIAENKEGKQVINTDVYTDNETKHQVKDLLTTAASKKGLVTDRFYTGIINWSTKEQDDRTAEFLEETLKDT